MDESMPVLVCTKALEPSFEEFANIKITCNDFSIGRGLFNNKVIPFLSISRTHCTFTKNNEDWFIKDNSSFGICVNGIKLGKGKQKVLSQDDIIVMEPSQRFVYRYTNDLFDRPRKRIKLEKAEEDEFLNDVKLKFEESQSYEIRHIEDKIQSAISMKETSRILKEQLQLDMERKIKQLENEFALQIKNLEGEKQQVEKQKAVLLAERNTQLACIKEQMEGKISELKDQIQKHNETESDLLKENSNLKEKLLKEREEFLAEISRESLSKQDTLDKLNAKIREQEEIRIKEKQELELKLRRETEELRLAKEKELKELEEQKVRREKELEEELSNIKQTFEKQIQEAEQEKLKAEQLLNEQMEQRKKLTDAEKVKRDELMQEREEIQKKLAEAQVNAQKSIDELKARVEKREVELTALAADRIQKQVDQSSQVIVSLQDQLERVKNQLQSVETEKQTLLEGVLKSNQDEAGCSKQSTLAHVGEVMESELQCSICAELFVTATTLNCSHTFCKYCITMWKKKKRDCPICRTSITSECKSLVLDSFIDRMVQNLTEEMKTKRQDMLKSRETEVTAMMAPAPRTTASPSSARRGRRRRPTAARPTTTMSTTAMTTDLTSIPISAIATTSTQPLTIVDLTTVPLPLRVPEQPPVIPTSMIELIQQNRVVFVIEEPTGSQAAPTGSQAAPEHSSASTGAASTAARAGTGPPAAPTGSAAP